MTAALDLRSAVRAANKAGGRRRARLGWLIPVLALPAAVASARLGGLAAVITTIPSLLVLLGLCVPVVAWAARTEPDERLARVMWIGFGAKLVGYVIRHLVITEVYGAGDAQGYHRAGAELARSYRSGEFAAPIPGTGGAGTAALKVITGVIYSATGSSLLVGALAFSLLSFTGTLLLVKAFRIGVPEGDHLRYGRLALLLPSMWFWPSSIGKEAWMVFSLGVLAYGAARVYSRTTGGLVLLAAGAAAGAVVRPHVALIAVGAATAALLLRSRHHRRRFNRIGKLLVLGPLVVASLVLVGKSERVLKVDDLSVTGVQKAGQLAGKQSDQGGSSFTPSPVHNVLQLPKATVTVLFRPFPFEARAALPLVISLEGSFLVLLALVSWRRVGRGLRALRKTPYLAMCALSTLLFVVAFSNFANFGILARERVQLLPFAFAFLAATRSRRQLRGDDTTAPPAPAPRFEILERRGAARGIAD